MSKVEQDAKFKQALCDEACDVVDTMLEQGYIPDPNNINVICQNGNVGLLTKLLNYPMDIQQGLFTAVLHSQTHLLDHLFIAGADVNLPDSDQNTALHLVQDVETCRWLLDMGARQTINRYGATPLICAVSREKEDVVKVMLSQEQGVQTIPISDINGDTPLFIACWNNFASIVELLLSYEQGVQSISIKNINGDTPLSLACWANYASIVELLLSYQQGVQTISIKNNNGNTPLFRACASGNANIVSLLLAHEQGVQTISMTNNEGNTSLSIACGYNYNDIVQLNIVQLLLAYEQGVQTISIPNNNGDTPLFIACCWDNSHVVKLLLSYKQGVQTIFMTNPKGETPFHQACYDQNIHMIELLLSHVCPHLPFDQVSKLLTQPDASGETPMSIAKKHPKVMAVLNKHVFGCTIQ